jgi:hypothetical protein
VFEILLCIIDIMGRSTIQGVRNISMGLSVLRIYWRKYSNKKGIIDTNGKCDFEGGGAFE